MEFPEYRTAVEQWITTVTEWYLPQPLRASDIFWNSRPRKYLGKVWIDAAFDRPTRIGHDGVHYLESDDPSPGYEIVPVIEGQRKVELDLEANTFRAEDDYDAIALIDLLSDSLQFPSINRLLHDAGLGFEAVLDSPNLNRMVLGQERQLSAARLRVRFHTVSIRADMPTTFVDKTQIASDLVTQAGTPASTQIDAEFS